MTAAELTAAALRKLDADIGADLQALERISTQLRGADALPGPGSEPHRAFLALQIDRYYTALEAVLERVARIVDGVLPTGSEWHRELLEGSLRPLPGIRPAVLPVETARELHGLLSFRHFLRHAYAAELDGERVEEHRTQVLRVHPVLSAGLDLFRQHLQRTKESLER